MLIKEIDKTYLLSLKPEELTFTKMKELLGNSLNKEKNKIIPARFKTNDHFELSPDEYFVSTKIVTTVGRFLFNKYLIERCGFEDIVGYINTQVSKKVLYAIEAKLSDALLKGTIDNDKYIAYIDYRDTLGLQLHPVITPSFTRNTIKPLKEVENLRDELIKSKEKELKKKDGKVITEIESKLIKKAEEILKSDPGLELYTSGARGNIINYKEMYIMKGAVSDYVTKEVDMIEKPFNDGLAKKDIPRFANQVIQAIYPKSVAPAESGTLSKAIVAGLQSVILNDKKGSFCSCKSTLNILITDKNSRLYRGRYILEGNKAIELTPERLPLYIGKTVKMFSPMFDIGDTICNVCAGNMHYDLGTKNIGLGFSRTANAITAMGMKKFHVTSVKTQTLNIDNLFL